MSYPNLQVNDAKILNITLTRDETGWYASLRYNDSGHINQFDDLSGLYTNPQEALDGALVALEDSFQADWEGRQESKNM